MTFNFVDSPGCGANSADGSVNPTPLVNNEQQIHIDDKNITDLQVAYDAAVGGPNWNYQQWPGHDQTPAGSSNLCRTNTFNPAALPSYAWAVDSGCGANSDAVIASGLKASVVHINELRNAINKMRTTAGFCPCTCTCTCDCDTVCGCDSIFVGCTANCQSKSSCGSHGYSNPEAFAFSAATVPNMHVQSKPTVRKAQIAELRNKINALASLTGCGTTSF